MIRESLKRKLDGALYPICFGIPIILASVALRRVSASIVTGLSSKRRWFSESTFLTLTFLRTTGIFSFLMIVQFGVRNSKN